ncbi:MAG: 30S ribosomal protein S17, partial [Dehalococcoidia bacterium]
MAGGRKTRLGTVVSDKMDKTVVVAVNSRRLHRIYKKAVRRTKRYKVHDEANACRVGDEVLIQETRPLSKEKRWRVAEIIARRALFQAPPPEREVEEEASTEPALAPAPTAVVEEPVGAAEEPAEAAVEEPVEAAVEEPVEEPAEAVAEEPVEAAVEEPAEAV